MQELHQEAHLGAGPVPILIGEGEQGQELDTQLARGIDNGAHRVLATPMAFQARQAALGGPATIAIHYDRDMAGKARGVQHQVGKLTQRQFRQFRPAPALPEAETSMSPQTSMTSASLAANT